MRFLFVLLLLLTSCSPQWRLEHLLKKHPELTHIDSVIIRDTVRITIPKVRIDTVVDIEELFILLAKSTFTAEVDNLLLGTMNAKVFYASKVEFTSVSDRVIINT